MQVVFVVTVAFLALAWLAVEEARSVRAVRNGVQSDMTDAGRRRP